MNIKALKARRVIHKVENRLVLKMALYLFLFFLIVVYGAPYNLWYYFPVLGEMVQSVGQIVPSVRKFSQLSEYPEVFSTAYAIGVLLWPILSIIYYNGPQREYFALLARSKKYRNKRLVISIFTTIFIVYAIFYFMPPESASGGKYSQLLSEMTKNRFVFSWMSAMSFTVLGVLASVMIINVMEYVRYLKSNN